MAGGHGLTVKGALHGYDRLCLTAAQMRYWSVVCASETKNQSARAGILFGSLNAGR